MASHKYPVTAVAASPREKGGITADSKGNIIVHYSTSQQKHLENKGGEQLIKNLTFAPKANGILAITEKNKLCDYS